MPSFEAYFKPAGSFKKEQQAFADAEQQGGQGAGYLLQPLPRQEQVGIHQGNHHESHSEKI
jgi:hypothetical protein